MDVRKIQNAIQWMKNGGLVIVADDEDVDNDLDLVLVSSKVNASYDFVDGLKKKN